MRSSLLVVALALPAAIAGALHFTSSRPSARPLAATVTTAAAPRWAHRAIVGRSLVYDLDLVQTSSMDPLAVLGGSSEAGPSRSRLAVAGRLVVTTLSHDESGIISRWRVESPRVEARGGKALAAALAAGFEVRSGADGRVHALRWPEGTPSSARGLLVHLPGRLQLGFPAGPASAWRHQEDEASGLLSVDYRARLDDGDGRVHIVRTPVAVVLLGARVTGAARRAGLAGRPSGQLEHVFDPARGLVERIDGAISLRIDARVEDTEVARFDEELHVRLAEVRLGASMAPLTMGAWQRLGEPLPVDLVRERREDERTLAGVDAAALIAGWRGLGELDDDARRAHLAQLRAHLALHPEAVHELLAEIRALGLADAGLDLGLSLAAASRDGQAALRALAEDWPEGAGAVLAALGRAPRPDAETLDLLEAELDGEASAGGARRGLGRALGHLREHDPAAATALGQRLAMRLQDAAPAEQRSLLILLGNGGAPELLPHARHALAADDAGAREDALLALRFVAGEEADQLLARSIREERDAPALLAALTALRYRTPSAITSAALRDRLAAGGLSGQTAMFAAHLLERGDKS